MLYLDTGGREADHTLARWLVQTVDARAAEIRFQSGYFGDPPLRLVSAELARVAQTGTVHAVVGSNQGRTTRTSLLALCSALGLPNPNVEVRVISYAAGLYHAKTFHVTRSDGSQAAYVGSANLTLPGTTVNVEAGITLDTATGDDPNVLQQVAAAVDDWLTRGPQQGAHTVASADDVDALVLAGIVSVLPPAPPLPQVAPAAPATPGAAGGANPPPQPFLAALVQIPAAPPALVGPTAPAAPPAPPVPPTPAAAPAPAAAPGPALQPGMGLPGYPVGVLFVGPNPTAASSGAAALTGAAAPGNAVGLVYAFQRALVTKTLGGQPGTTDVNLPLDVLPLVRFGLFGPDAIPRAEFVFEIRYLDQQAQEPLSVPRQASTTAITYRGVGPIAGTKPGHRDIRLLIPVAAKRLGTAVQAAQLPVPAVGDYLMLEFPTIATPNVRVSFLDPASPLHAQLSALAATTPNVGHGNAWWLPTGVSPTW